MSETTAQGFSPALRAALTPVTGALFFKPRAFFKPHRWLRELAPIAPAY